MVLAKRKMVFNTPSMKPRRQGLRAKSTLAEKVLWSKLRNNQLGYKFFRQYSVEGYVIDFYCPEKRIGIEVEGEIHKMKRVKIYDKYRERYLEAFTIRLLKFSNNEVLENIKNVIKRISVFLS